MYLKSRSLVFLILNLCFYYANGQVQNGTFESWTGTAPDQWTTIDSGIDVIREQTIVKEGSSSAKIIVNTVTQSNTDLRQTVNVTIGQPYTFSVWVYHTEGGVRLRLYVDGYQVYSDPTVLNQWQPVSYTITPTISTIEVGARFYDVAGFDGSEAVYIDLYEPTEIGSGGGGCTDTEVVLDLLTDNYGAETSWEITSGATILFSGSGYANNTAYQETFCLTDGNYVFTIYDSYGDGICCAYGSGSYELTATGVVLASGGAFGASEATSFTIGSGGGSGGYYDAAAGLSGYSLKTALHNIIKTHTSQGYSALWTFYSANELDNYYENDGTILDIYSENPLSADPYTYTKSIDQCGTYTGEGDCYNREHSFPRSWFGGSIEPMNSDVHHIFASDGYVNSKRSSYPYGVVSSATYTSLNGSRLGSAAATLGYSGTVFEPIDEFKGDIARAAFYMATRYEDVIAGWETNSTYGNAVLNGTSNQVFETWALNMLIDWHNSDPVSAKEIARNEAAYTFQGNRNPYVDHPEYIASIWGTGGAAVRIINDHTSPITVHYAEQQLSVQHGPVKPVSIRIVDLSGHIVGEWKTPSGNYSETNVPVKLMANSLYLIQVYTEDKMMTHKLLVK